MFGIIYILVIAGLLLIGGIKAAGENVEGMKRGKERQRQGKNLQGTYYDRLGAERLLSTGQLASVYPDYSDPCDDKWLWVGAPSKKTRNMSEEQRKMRFDETKRIGKFQGRTVDVYDKRYWSTAGGNRYKVVIHGTFYRDLRNDKTYVCREFDLLYNPKTDTFRLQKGYRKTDIEQNIRLKYYMDVETARLVRIADTQTLEYSEELAEKFKQVFNNQQACGGWYKSDDTHSLSGALKPKQDFYCDDFAATDHIYSLYDLRQKAEKEKTVDDQVYKEINHL